MNFWKKKKSNDVNKPVVNPGLKNAFKKFALNKTEATLNEIVNEISTATFLVLIRTDELNYNSTEGHKVLIEKGNKIKFINTFDEHNNLFLPIFTDWAEIDLWVKNREGTAGWMMTADDVFAIVRSSNYKGLVINVCTDKWQMTTDQISLFIKEIRN
jgi:hypothetical protein